jgi:hypothetical protein
MLRNSGANSMKLQEIKFRILLIFRYYFQDPAIGRRLPVEYPLTTPTLKLVSEILAKTYHNSSRPTSSAHAY